MTKNIFNNNKINNIKQYRKEYYLKHKDKIINNIKKY